MCGRVIFIDHHVEYALGDNFMFVDLTLKPVESLNDCMANVNNCSCNSDSDVNIVFRLHQGIISSSIP